MRWRHSAVDPPPGEPLPSGGPKVDPGRSGDSGPSGGCASFWDVESGVMWRYGHDLGPNSGEIAFFFGLSSSASLRSASLVRTWSGVGLGQPPWGSRTLGPLPRRVPPRVIPGQPWGFPPVRGGVPRRVAEGPTITLLRGRVSARRSARPKTARSGRSDRAVAFLPTPTVDDKAGTERWETRRSGRGHPRAADADRPRCMIGTRATSEGRTLCLLDAGPPRGPALPSRRSPSCEPCDRT